MADDRFTKGGGIDLVLYQVVTWARETFPNQDDERIVKHLMEEMEELRACVLYTPGQDVAEHIADCMILLASLADIFRIPLRQAIADKHAINMSREWAYDPERGYDKHVGVKAGDGMAAPGGQSRG